ncbi:hypothetical protein NKH98_32315, partial [Mesorhizobium sp. M0833]|uniref:hypothetical protein n=1 Tax=Mesorhizobium sp. M0833 TaxID=2957009 RepID=UPI003334D6B4
NPVLAAHILHLRQAPFALNTSLVHYLIHFRFLFKLDPLLVGLWQARIVSRPQFLYRSRLWDMVIYHLICRPNEGAGVM